jgi:PAS domain-containing protein
MFSLDQTGRLTDVNRNWELLFGLHASKVKGMTFANLLTFASRPAFEFAFAETHSRDSFAGPVLKARNKTTDEQVSLRIYFLVDRHQDDQASQIHCVLIKLDKVSPPTVKA